MRVAHLDLERGWRGGQRQVFLLLRELAALGVEQALVARRGEPLAERAASLPGVRVIPVGGRLGAFLAVRREPSPKVIHAHASGVLPAAILARRPGDAVVVTRRLDLAVSRLWYGRADRVAAISEGVGTSLVASGIAASKVVRIPSGIDRTRRLDRSTRAGLRQALGVPENALLGLTAGALEEQKDPLTLVRAMSDAPGDYHHLWVGDGSLRPAVERLLAGTGAASRFHLAGFDPDPDRWFAAADLFVLPSVHEGLGTVLLDAFHFGLPVIGARIQGTAELLTDGETALLVPPGDPAGLASAIGRLARDRDLRERLAEAGRGRVAAYDIRATAASYLDLYRSPTPGSRPPSLDRRARKA